MSIVNFVFSSILIYLFISLMFYCAFLRIKNKKLRIENSQFKFDIDTGIKFLAKEVHDEPTNQEKAKDDFIKFLSDSRGVAYDYIENVQSKVSDFISEVGPIIEYHKKYGDTVPMEPFTQQLNSIAASFDKLKDILPEDGLVD